MNNNRFYDPALKNRHKKARRFKLFSQACIVLTLAFIAFFLYDIVSTAMPAARQGYILLEVHYPSGLKGSTRKAVEKKYRRLISRSWFRDLKKRLQHNPGLAGTTAQEWILADDQVDQYMKGHHYKLTTKALATIKQLEQQGRIELQWNRQFFSHGDSKLPESAGIRAALTGSLLTLIITMAIAFPVGVLTAIYLEEFAREHFLSRLVEVNINNLAAIPSILFGLLGLSIFINLFGLPRSSPVVGGLTLALMTLPIIIVSARAALKSVPESIRQAGYGLGLNKIQIVRDHVLPVAMPGILTGSIIGLAQAMGETAPLIIIGMIAFIPNAPSTFNEATTVLPAQIYTWAGMPERAYVEKTAAGIVVILVVLVSLNAIAIYLRKKYEIKWQ